MQNFGNFELNFEKFDKKLRLQTNFTDVYESSKFVLKSNQLQKYAFERKHSKSQTHKPDETTQAQAVENMFNNFISLLE